ncbi:Rh17 [macacine betaherpesvirus 3]|nr:Rh17 [macacine betaherpesvirus 3]
MKKHVSRLMCAYFVMFWPILATDNSTNSSSSVNMTTELTTLSTTPRSTNSSYINSTTRTTTYGSASTSQGNTTTPMSRTVTSMSYTSQNASCTSDVTLTSYTNTLSNESTNVSRNNSYTTTTSWTSTPEMNITTPPPWPFEMHGHYFTLWVNNCYCGYLKVLPGSNITFNGTKKNDTDSIWFLARYFNYWLCIFTADANYTMDYINLTHTCTSETMTLWNVLEGNSGIYFQRRTDNQKYDSTYICYILNVTADAANTTYPEITTTKCHRPPWRNRPDFASIEAHPITPDYEELSIQDILESLSLKGGLKGSLLKFVLRFGWLCGIVVGVTVTLIIILKLPQKLCFLSSYVPQRRGYKRLSSNQIL